MTEVLNLETGNTYTYLLSPEEALVAAFEQFERGNFNTWDYRSLDDYAGVSRRPHSIRLGNMAVYKKHNGNE